MNLDGTVAAYRFPFLLAGGSLVFKQDSPYVEHFYSDLKPYEHYVPVRRDLSDLVEKIQWARENDDEARAIAERGARYAKEKLMPKNVLCYHAEVLKQWHERLKQPKVSDKDLVEMEKFVEEDTGPSHMCSCPQNNVKDEL